MLNHRITEMQCRLSDGKLSSPGPSMELSNLDTIALVVEDAGASSSTDARVKAVTKLGIYLRSPEIAGGTRQGVLLHVLPCLTDKNPLVRKAAITALGAVATQPKVYQALCDFIDPESSLTPSLKTDFQVRRTAAHALRQAVRIPYVRDTFLRSLEKPEKSYEVRQALVQGLGDFLRDPERNLCDENLCVAHSLLKRRDMNREVMKILDGIHQGFKYQHPELYQMVTTKIGQFSISTGGSQHLFSGDPFLSKVHLHCGDGIPSVGLRGKQIQDCVQNHEGVRCYEGDFSGAHLGVLWKKGVISKHVRERLLLLFEEDLLELQQRPGTLSIETKEVVANILWLTLVTGEDRFDHIIESLDEDQVASFRDFVPLYDGVTLNMERIEASRERRRREGIHGELSGLLEHFCSSNSTDTEKIVSLLRFLSLSEDSQEVGFLNEKNLSRLGGALKAFFGRSALSFDESIRGLHSHVSKFQLSVVLSALETKGENAKFLVGRVRNMERWNS